METEETATVLQTIQLQAMHPPHQHQQTHANAVTTIQTHHIPIQHQ
jgi:hypothetical protein